MKIQGCCDKIEVSKVIDKDCTVIIFASLEDMLDFCGHHTRLLGEDIFCKICWQFVTNRTCYALKFKTVDFDTYIQK